MNRKARKSLSCKGWEAVIKDFVRSTGVIKKEVLIDKKFISATIFLEGLANLKTNN